MNNSAKRVLLVLLIIYIISPIDACPGPVDDVLAAILGMGMIKGDSE